MLLRFLISNSLLLIWVLSDQLYAQESSTTEVGIPDIIVYSTKRAERLLDVPATIDILEQKELYARNVQSLYDVGRSVSNVIVQQTGLYKSVSIRGIGGGGRNPGFGTRVGVYLDGVYVGQTLALDNPLINTEQIEIFKGPQGFLFGNNSDAGVINIQSQQPNHQSQLVVQSVFGNYDYSANTLTASGELLPNLTARFMAVTENRNGYVENNYNGDALKGLQNLALRTQLTLEVSQDINISLSADYMHKQHTQFLGQAQTGLFGEALDIKNNSFYKTNRNKNPKADVTSGGVHLKADYYLNDGMISAITAYRAYSNHITNDNDYSDIDLINTFYHDQIEQYSQELRYNSPDYERLKYTAGLYFSREINRTDSKLVLGEDTNTLVTLPSIGSAFPFNTVFGVSSGAVLPLKGKVTTDIASAFSKLEFALAPKFKLHAGARLSSEFKQLDLSMDGSQSGLLNMATIQQGRDSIKNSFLSPMLGFSYHPEPNTQFFVTATKSFKGGGWNVEVVTQSQADKGLSYDPESVISLEMGVKSRQHNTTFAASVFRNYLSNYQVFQYSNLGGPSLQLLLRNAAEARTQGLEFDISHAISDGLTVRGNLAFLDARYISFPNGSLNGKNAAGEILPDSPRLSGSIGVNYLQHLAQTEGSVNWSLQNSFQSSTVSGASSDPSINHLNGRAVLDANVTYQSARKNWQWMLWVKNLANKEYAYARSSDAFGNIYVIYAEPRMYGVSGQYHF